MNSISDLLRMGSFVGFDDLFNNLDQVMETATKKVTWPPYDIVKFAENAYKLQFALAGFSPDDVSVRKEGKNLIVEGNLQQDERDKDSYLYRGIAMRDFLVKFLLADGMEVKDVVFDNGILSIDVKKKVDVQPNRLDFSIRTSLGNTKSSSPDAPTEERSVLDEMVEASTE